MASILDSHTGVMQVCKLHHGSQLADTFGERNHGWQVEWREKRTDITPQRLLQVKGRQFCPRLGGELFAALKRAVQVIRAKPTGHFLEVVVWIVHHWAPDGGILRFEGGRTLFEPCGWVHDGQSKVCGFG